MTAIQSVLDDDLKMSNHARFLKKHGMYTAAVFYKNMNEPIGRRAARVTRYVLENQSLPEYQDGQRLMSAAPYNICSGFLADDLQDYGFFLNANAEIYFEEQKFMRLREECADSVELHIVDSIIRDCKAAYAVPSRCRYDHGGVHNVADIQTVLDEGIIGYAKRAQEKIASAKTAQERRFAEGILDVIAGIACYLDRYILSLEEKMHCFDGNKERMQRLITALKKVPMHPAETFYEAYVAATAVMFLANAFEPGRMDVYLYPYYQRDLEAGLTTEQEAHELFRELFTDIDARIGHPGVTHATIGGTLKDGTAAYNVLTRICVQAIGGLRTPNVTLRVRRDMPQEIWDAFLLNISKGYAQPAIVNEELYLENLTKDYAIPYEDAVNYVFGGCSELLIQGKTMCDSTWVAYNMLDIFEQALYNYFYECDTFAQFYDRLKQDYQITLHEMAEQINLRQFSFGNHYPWPLATLFTGDCIENAENFTNGGARYNFDSANIYAGTNAINSLYTLKQFYEGKLGDISKEEFLQCLTVNFAGYEDLFARCKKVTKFGNYDEELHALAADLMDFVFSETMTLQCWRGNEKYRGRFMPAVILWVDWITCGEKVGATPDGRLAGQATADCCGPMQGTDKEGPTSVMAAALSVPQNKGIGTCVLNLRLDKAVFEAPEGEVKVQQLCQTYFKQGGCQLQINVLDPEALLKALQNPEDYGNLVVRVGGFSDNFVKLSPAIQKEVIKRTQYAI
ncbi:MAG: hypothetical protein IKC46_02640 [Lachnospiraceae bacterium]|nr:hypothetical protein [Lachnospiraceae bacterium]